jgi:hypothetical protein
MSQSGCSRFCSAIENVGENLRKRRVSFGPWQNHSSSQFDAELFEEPQYRLRIIKSLSNAIACIADSTAYSVGWD